MGLLALLEAPALGTLGTSLSHLQELTKMGAHPAGPEAGGPGSRCGRSLLRSTILCCRLQLDTTISKQQTSQRPFPPAARKLRTDISKATPGAPMGYHQVDLRASRSQVSPSTRCLLIL